MKNYKFYLFLFVLTIFCVTGSFAVLYLPDDRPQEKYDIGKIRMMYVDGKIEWREYELYSYRPIEIDFSKMANARIELVVPHKEARHKTTVVFYLPGVR